MRPAASSPLWSPRPERYPFDRATSSFFLAGGDDPLPAGRPLLAYGANGSPGALAAKLPGVPVAGLVACLHGYAIVHSAHVSPYGAVPATLIEAAGARSAVHVILLTDRAPLDATEPNYDLVTLLDVHLDVERLGRLTEVDAYVSKHGPLIVDGAPVALGARPQDELRRLAAS